MNTLLYKPKFSFEFTSSNIFSNTLGANPLFYVDPSPIIVNVLPVPVGPYANIHTLNPSMTLVINPYNSSKILSYEDS